jgi:uncharacterized membrane protein YgdD (TMEM256/DUF423 family)
MNASPLEPRAARFAVLGAISAFLAVVAGAFGAHALRSRLIEAFLQAFETGARYQFLHALALFAVAWALDRTGQPAVARAGWLFVAGTILFSGSLYALALSGITRFGMITPLGGLCFLAGWLFLAFGLARR